jgi:hypothetical protein
VEDSSLYHTNQSRNYEIAPIEGSEHFSAHIPASNDPIERLETNSEPKFGGDDYVTKHELLVDRQPYWDLRLQHP